MSDFRIQVQAELDASKLTSQLNELKSQKVPIKVEMQGLDDKSVLKSLEKLTKNDKKINVGVNVTGGNKLQSITRELSNLKKLSVGSNKIKIDIGGSTSKGSGSVKDTISDYKLLKNLADEIGKKKVTLAGLDTTKSVNQVKELENQIKSLETKYNSLFSSSKGNLTDNQLSNLDQIFDKSANKASELSAKMKDVANDIASSTSKAFNDIKREVETGSFDVVNAKMNTALSKYEGQSSEEVKKLRANAKQVKDIQEEITKALSEQNVDGEKVNSLYDKLAIATEKYSNSLKVVKEIGSATFSASEAEIAANKVQTYMNNNTRALKKYGSELESIMKRYREARTLEEKSFIDVDYKKLQSKVSAEGLTGKSFFQDFKRAFSQISQFTGVYAIAQNILQDAPRVLVEAVREVNSAQIELRKVSEASDSQLVSYWDQAAESAKKYGATISDVISSTADWSRLGYNLEDSKLLSDVTTLYQRVGDNMTQETASQSLVSTLQGFNISANQAESVIDKFNEVANNYAIGSDGIGEALQRSAASFNAAHTSLSKSIALITGTRWYKLVRCMETYI